MEREDERRPLIGEVARLTGFPTKTLRFYDDLGLVRPGARPEADYRLYRTKELAKLGFVNQAKLIGLRLDEIGPKGCHELGFAASSGYFRISARKVRGRVLSLLAPGGRCPVLARSLRDRKGRRR